MSKRTKIEKCIQKGNEAELLRLFSASKDKEEWLEAIEGMGKIGTDDSFNALISILNEEDYDIHLAFIRALGQLRNLHADTHLRYLLDRETDEKTIEAIRESLQILRKEGR